MPSGGYYDVPFNDTTHLLVHMGAEILPNADPRYEWTHRTSSGWWEGVLKGGSGPMPGTAAVSASTGVNPNETAYALYGHTVPVSVFGVGRIGGDIISGPWQDSGRVSGGVSFGVAADPTGTRTLLEIAFDSEVVWTLADGFLVEPFTFRFYEGTYSQGADPLETTHFGADAVAYIAQMMLFIQDLPLAGTKFQKFPYISCKISDGTGNDVNLGEAFTRLALSPWVGLTADQFETTDITDGLVDGGLIIAQDTEFLQLIQQFGRFYQNWDILQTDKLRIVDRGATVAPDIVLGKSNLMGQVAIARTDPSSIPRELILSTIDGDADYTIVPSKASFPRDPVSVSSSVKSETQYLPMIMDSATRASLVTYTKYYEEIARKKITARCMIFGAEIEPGALVGFADLLDGIADETFKVKETTHGADYSVEIVAESFMDCQIPTGDPYWESVVLLMGFEDVDASTGAPGLTDESPAAHGVAGAGGAAEIDTAQFRFGASSLKLAPTDDFVFYTFSTDWALSNANSDQFAIEYSIYYSTVSSGVSAVSLNHAADGTFGFEIRTSGTEIQYRWSPTGLFADIQTLTTSGVGLVSGQWYAIKVSKDSAGKIRIYVDGVMKGSATPADSTFHAVSAPQTLTIGGRISGSSAPDAWIDELRITKGDDRDSSDSDYTVSSSAFPRE